jgi:hypothetical protein
MRPGSASPHHRPHLGCRIRHLTAFKMKKLNFMIMAIWAADEMWSGAAPTAPTAPTRAVAVLIRNMCFLSRGCVSRNKTERHRNLPVLNVTCQVLPSAGAYGKEDCTGSSVASQPALDTTLAAFRWCLNGTGGKKQLKPNRLRGVWSASELYRPIDCLLNYSEMIPPQITEYQEWCFMGCYAMWLL